MDFLRRIEDDVRNLGVEAKRKYPEVKDASDRALVTLKLMRESYVAELMKHKAGAGQAAPPPPRIGKFRSADVSAPYVLACHHTDSNSKIVLLALNGLQMLLNYEVVPPAEVHSILRVLTVQMNNGKSEIQLKVLQVVLQLANSLVVDPSCVEYLTPSIMAAMFAIAFQLCDANANHSTIASTGFATARQLMALIMDDAMENLLPSSSSAGSPAIGGPAGGPRPFDATSGAMPSQLPKCAELFILDLGNFIRSQPADWLKGVQVTPYVAMDLIYEAVNGWRRLFLEVTVFRSLLSQCISSSVKPFLRSLREDYITTLKTTGAASSNAQVSLVVKIARSLLLNFLGVRGFLLEAEMLVNLMMNSILPEKLGNGSAAAEGRQIVAIEDGNKLRYDDGSIQIIGLGTGVAAIAGGLMRLAIQAGGGIKSVGAGVGVGSGQTGQVGAAYLRGSGVAGQGFIAVSTALPNATSRYFICGPNGLGDVLDTSANSYSALGSSSGGSDVAYIPTYPIAACLETVLGLFLSDRACDIMAVGLGGDDALRTIYTSIINRTCTFLTEALGVESNVRDFEQAVKSSHISALLETVFSGSYENSVTDSRDAILRGLHEFVHAPSGISSAELMILAFHVVQILTRALNRCSLQCQMAPTDDAATSPAPSSAGPATPPRSTVAPTSTQSPAPSPMKSSTSGGAPSATSGVFVPMSVLSALPFPTERLLVQVLRTSARAVVMETNAKFRVLCMTIMWKIDDSIVVRRCLGMLTEFVLITGYMGLSRECDALISSLCRCVVPYRRGDVTQAEGAPAAGTSVTDRGSMSIAAIADRQADLPLLQWRNMQAFVRLTQAVHALADVIVDWETVMDTYVQLIGVVFNQRFSPDEVTPMEIDKIFNTIQRFKEYSVFLCDSALIRLTTSLVSLSINAIGNSVNSPVASIRSSNEAEKAWGKSSNSILSSAADVVQRIVNVPDVVGGAVRQLQGGGGGQNEGSVNAPLRSSSANSQYWAVVPPYMLEPLATGMVSYALYAAIDIVKINAFRLSCVWQMVSSHLRMVALHKSSAIRTLSVAATNDLISMALHYMKSPQTPQQQYLEDARWTPPPAANAHPQSGLLVPPQCLTLFTDTLQFNFIVPSFEKVFFGQNYHKLRLLKNVADTSSHLLAQSDLLNSLIALTSIPYDDIRNGTIEGLYNLLQEGGHAVEGGWEIVLELLLSVPSGVAEGGAKAPLPSVGAGATAKPDFDSGYGQPAWSREALQVAFSCLKLVVDDFLDLLPHDVIIKAVNCVSAFSAQNVDVNISLTSIEMLWKVTDYMMMSSRKVGDEKATSVVMDVMLSRLALLSVDSRPEIRNCATNTLFSAVLSNANFLASSQWRHIFDDVVFPLFAATEQKSVEALSSNEEAQAPELKKGVRMAIHHSRDTAHKQWLETRVLALRGTCRIMRSGARNLSLEPWFIGTWYQALDVCLRTLQIGTVDLEVCNASVDMIFDMVKMVSSQAYRSKARAGKGMRVVGGALTVDESQIARTPAEIRASSSAAAAASSSGGSNSASTAVPAVPQSEADGHLEIAREKLWQMAWAAVRSCVCIDRVGSELPLHTCQQLQDLYLGGIDGEFRYSQNVKSLLDLVLCLARPRVGVSIANPQPKPGKSFSLDGTSTDDNRSAQATAKMNKIADAQFHRGIINLLRSIVTVDIVSFSALVATLSKLAFGRSFMEMAYYLWPAAKSTSTEYSYRCIVLAPVDPKLRSEAGEYLHTILNAKEDAKAAANSSSSAVGDGSSSAPTSSLPAVFLDLPPEWNAVALEVVVHHFVQELCANPSISRSNLVDLSRGKVEVAASKGEPLSSPSKPATGGFTGFFSAIGRMITSSLETDDDENGGSEDGSDAGELHASGNSTASFGHTRSNIFDDVFSRGGDLKASGKIDFTGHTIQPLRESVSASILANASPVGSLPWSPFMASPIDLKVLHIALRNGIRPMFSTQRADSKSPVLTAKQKAVWSQILTSILCVLSAWRPKELGPRQLDGPGNQMGASVSSAASSLLQSDCPYLPVSGAEAKAYSDLTIGAVDIVKTFFLSSSLGATTSSMLLNLIDCVSACCRVLVLAVHAAATATAEAPHETPHASAEAVEILFVTNVNYCQRLLSSLGSSDELSPAVRKRSIKGVISISHDVLNILEFEETPPVLERMGVTFMHLLIAMDSGLELLPSESMGGALSAGTKSGGITASSSSSSSASSSHSVASVLSAWHDALSEALRIKAQDQDAASEPRPAAAFDAGDGWAASIAGGTPFLGGTMRNKAHILLFNSTANRLMRHSSADVRDAAEAMMRKMDMGDVLRSVLDLSRRVTELEAQNADLKADLNLAKSAVHY